MKKNLLALDLGKTSLGIAISRTGFLVSPLKTIFFSYKDYDSALSQLEEILKIEKVETIVLGLPLYPSGDACEMTHISYAFRKKLLKFKIEIVMQDERYSTVDASSYLYSENMKAKKQKNIIDTYSACIILERYLRSIGQIT